MNVGIDFSLWIYFVNFIFFIYCLIFNFDIIVVNCSILYCKILFKLKKIIDRNYLWEVRWEKLWNGLYVFCNNIFLLVIEMGLFVLN